MSHRMPVMAMVRIETAGGSGSAARGLGVSFSAIFLYGRCRSGDQEVREYKPLETCWLRNVVEGASHTQRRE